MEISVPGRPPATFAETSPPNTRLQHAAPDRLHRRELLVRYSVSVPVVMAQYDHSGRVLKFMIRTVDHLRATTKCVYRRFSEVVELHERVGRFVEELKGLLPVKLLTTRSNSCTDEIELRRESLGRYFATFIDALFLKQHVKARPVEWETYRVDAAHFLDLHYEPAMSTTTLAVAAAPELRVTSTSYGYFSPPTSFASVPSNNGSFTANAFRRRPRSVSPSSPILSQAVAATIQDSSSGYCAAAADVAGEDRTPGADEGSAVVWASSSPSMASSVCLWEEALQRREETWWAVSQSRLPPAPPSGNSPNASRRSASSGSRHGSAPRFLTHHFPDSYEDYSQSREERNLRLFGAGGRLGDGRPRRRVVGFVLPLMECRLEIDGTWTVIVRHDRNASHSLVRRRRGEAMYLLRHIDNCEYLPSVAQLRDVLKAFKVNHPQQDFEDTQVRLLRGVLGHHRQRVQLADDEDAIANQSVSTAVSASALRPVDDAVDELNRDAVSEVTDATPAPGAAGRRGGRGLAGGEDRSGRGSLNDGLETLTGSHRRLTADTSARAPNSQHFPFSAITIVPAARLGAAASEGERDSPDTTPVAARSWRRWNFGDAERVAALSPSQKVKIKPKTAIWESCGCTPEQYCTSNGTGDVYRTKCGHCIVVHPKPAPPESLQS